VHVFKSQFQLIHDPLVARDLAHPQMERFVGGLGIVSLGVGIMFAGFALCVLAALAGIGQFTLPVGGIHKEVGFWSALNWSTTCLILFPLFMVFLPFKSINAP
jgi:hypothetical protein